MAAYTMQVKAAKPRSERMRRMTLLGVEYARAKRSRAKFGLMAEAYAAVGEETLAGEARREAGEAVRRMAELREMMERVAGVAGANGGRNGDE